MEPQELLDVILVITVDQEKPTDNTESLGNNKADIDFHKDIVPLIVRRPSIDFVCKICYNYISTFIIWVIQEKEAICVGKKRKRKITDDIQFWQRLALVIESWVEYNKRFKLRTNIIMMLNPSGDPEKDISPESAKELNAVFSKYYNRNIDNLSAKIELYEEWLNRAIKSFNIKCRHVRVVPTKQGEVTIAWLKKNINGKKMYDQVRSEINASFNNCAEPRSLDDIITQIKNKKPLK